MSGTPMKHYWMQLVTVLAVVATSAQVLNAAAAPFAPSRDTTLSGQVFCSRIEIPAGVTLTASSDLILESDDEIVVNGALEVMASTSHIAAASAHSRMSGVSITLRAKNRIIIDGEVRAGSGMTAPPSAVLPSNGYDGGTVILDAPVVYGRGEIFGGDGGSAAGGGRGGRGGSVEVLGLAGSTDSDDLLTLTGGSGGSGGSGIAGIPSGGDGGDGGDAFAMMLTDGTPGDPGSDVTGSNGLCALTITPCADGPDAFSAGASATGGNGGPGGDATAGGQGGNGGRGGHAVGGQGGCGGDGRNCTSGPGGDGGNGKNGGSATGGRGGNGGDGGGGCPSAVGGPGGNGGVGGNATGGNGGNGGDGGIGGTPPIVLLGAGGNGANGGNATSGSGGHGGHGGVGVAGGSGGAAGSSGSRVAGAGGLAGTGAPAGTPGSGGSTAGGSSGTAGTTGASCSGNSVYIESKSVQSGETNVTLGIFLSNLIPIEGLILPLEIRSITAGSFIANSFDLSVTSGKRVASLSPPMSYVDQERGAVSAISCSGPTSHSFDHGNPIDFSSPDGALFVAQRTIGPSLLAGSDPAGTANASLQLTFDVTSTPGTFEIDTCCCTPSNHLGFIDEFVHLQIPSFFKGVVTILPCGCDCHGDPVCDGSLDITDIVATIGVAFRGSPVIADPNSNCPYETTDVNCSNSTDVLDVVKIVSVAFRGADPVTEFCNPCP